MENIENLRSSFTPDGQRIFLGFNKEINMFVVATRWQFLAKLDNLKDATQLFEVVEFLEGDLKPQSKIVLKEMKRVSASSIIGDAMARTNHLLDCLEKRLQGLRPMYCGSKGSVIKWIEA